MQKADEVRERIRELDAVLNAFVEILPRSPDLGGPGRGTVGVKDCFYDGGRAPTMGSRVYAPPWEGTAEVLTRLRTAGFDVVGYTNLHEWAIGGTSAVTATGPVRNPWDLALVAGGSSGGSAAALAAGLVDVAIGTDTGGSIRIPAACCGVVGLKPTQGRVPTVGYAGDGGPTDQIGPMGRSVDDVRSLFEVLVAERLEDVEAGSLTVGVARGLPFDNVQDEVGVGFESAVTVMEKVARVVDVQVPDWDEQWWANAVLFISDTARRVTRALEETPELFQPDALKVLEWGASRTDEVIAAQFGVQDQAKKEWSARWDDIDALMTPTLPSLPPEIDALEVHLPTGVSTADVAFGRFCGPMNLVGVPCLSLPGAQMGALTTNISLSAPGGRDDRVLALGRAFEDATDRAWVNRVATPPSAQ
jgi:aspartyl-tRNA(Asn)/glutamyl-tRNA(Gln) amidotransferase subunit A